MKSTEITKICDVLWAARTDENTKTTYAIKRRAQMLAALKHLSEDELKNDYRFVWFQKHMQNILLTLDAASEDLHKTQPFEACSLQDYIDLLQASMNRVKAVGEALRKSPSPPQDP